MVSVPWPAPLPSFRQGLNPIEAAPPPGLSALLGGVNDWRGKNRNLLVGIGADLLSGQWGSHTPQGSALDQQQQEKLKAEAKAAEQQNATLAYFAKKYPDLAAAVQAGMPIGQAWQTAMEREAPQSAQAQPADVQTYQFYAAQETAQGRQPLPFGEWRKGGNQTPRAGVGQPIFGRNRATGAIEPWQSMTDGTMVNIANPGADPSQYDFSPGVKAEASTTATVDAKTAAAARAALPGAEIAANQTLKAIELIRKDTAGATDQFGNTFGIPNRNLPIYPGVSPRANWQANFSTAESGAFMAARQALKGGGQITDYEGQKASEAYSRMQQAVEKGDKANFDLALADFEDAVNQGLAKLREVANSGYAAGQPAVTGSGQTFVYNPATGELE